MTIVSPNFIGIEAFDHTGRGAAQALFSDNGAQTVADPLVVWTCAFGVRGAANPALLAEINLVAKNEAREMGFRCVIIRKEPHETQYERTAQGQPTMTFNTFTNRPQRTMIDADLHITVFMGNGLKKCHIHGHIYLERDPTDTNAVAIKVKKMSDPAMRRYVPPGEEPVTSEYWLLKGIQAIALDKKTLVRGE
jgi:hypothetical protein